MACKKCGHMGFCGCDDLDTAMTAVAKSDYGHGNSCACNSCFNQFQIAKRRVMADFGLTRDHQIHGYAVEAIAKRMEGPALPPLPATPPLGELMTMIRQAVRHEVRSLLMEYKVDQFLGDPKMGHVVSPNALKDTASKHVIVTQGGLRGHLPDLGAAKAVFPASMVKDMADKCHCPVDVVINTGCKCGGK